VVGSELHAVSCEMWISNDFNYLLYVKVNVATSTVTAEKHYTIDSDRTQTGNVATPCAGGSVVASGANIIIYYAFILEKSGVNKMEIVKLVTNTGAYEAYQVSNLAWTTQGENGFGARYISGASGDLSFVLGTSVKAISGTTYTSTLFGFVNISITTN